MTFTREALTDARRLVELVVMVPVPRWETVGEVAEELRTNYALPLELRVLSSRRLYGLVRRTLETMRREGLLERCLGADDGREVRVYRSRAADAEL